MVQEYVILSEPDVDFLGAEVDQRAGLRRHFYMEYFAFFRPRVVVFH